MCCACSRRRPGQNGLFSLLRNEELATTPHNALPIFVDPLKPFTSLHSFRLEQSQRVESAPRTAEAFPTGSQQQTFKVADTPTINLLQRRLRTRLASLDKWDSGSARKLFVECALTSELGDELANDPAFSRVVQRVTQQLGIDAKQTARLDELLERRGGCLKSSVSLIRRAELSRHRRADFKNARVFTRASVGA